MRMEYNKFKKGRSVDPLYLHVPTAYVKKINGSRQNAYSHVDEDDIRKNILIQKIKKLGIKISNSIDLFDAMTILGKNVDCLTFDKIMEDVDKKTYKKIQKINNKDFDKEFTIIEFLGKRRVLCGWRNTNTCKVGKTFVLPIINKNKKTYILYKNQKIYI
jgi:hypothetical protein